MRSHSLDGPLSALSRASKEHVGSKESRNSVFQRVAPTHILTTPISMTTSTRSLTLKWFPRVRLLALIGAAGMVSACADGTAPKSPSRDAGALAPDSHGLVQSQNLTVIDVPGAMATTALAISDSGVVVGRYASAGRTHGFLRSATGVLSTVDFPGAGFTVVGAVNNHGDIVGWYTLPAAPAIRHGFLLRHGEFSTFDPPGSTFTNALGINDDGDIVGRFCTKTVCREPGKGDFHGFLLRHGEFTSLDVPGSIETNGWKINNRGQVLGVFGSAAGWVHLFLRSNGELHTFALRNGGALSEENGGINQQGDIVGRYCDLSPCLFSPEGHGFALIDGHLITIDIPGATGTIAFGINVRREVVGFYIDTSGALHGYVLRLETHG